MLRSLHLSLIVWIALGLTLSCGPGSQPVEKQSAQDEKTVPEETGNIQEDLAVASESNEISNDLVLATFMLNGTTEEIEFGTVEEEIRFAAPPSAEEEAFIKSVRASLLNHAIGKYLLHERKQTGELPESTQLLRKNPRLLGRIVSLYRGTVLESTPEPTTEEIEQYYQENQTQFKEEEQHFIRYMTFLFYDPDDEEAVEEARERAERALQRIKQGEDFSQVSRDLSDVPEENREELIELEPSMHPNIVSAVRALEQGEITDVVPIRNGFLIAKLITHRQEKVSPLAQVRDTLKARVAHQKRQEHWDEYWKQKQEEIDIQRHYDVLEQEEVEENDVVFAVDDVETTYGDLQDIFGVQDEITRDHAERILNQEIILRILKKEGYFDKELVQQLLQHEQTRRLISEKFQGIAESSEAPLEEADIQAYYEKNPERFVGRKETKLKVLRFQAVDEEGNPVRRPTKPQMASAFREAHQAYRRLQEGEDFDKLMEEYNGDWEGNMDFAPMGPRGRVIDMAADKLEVGEYTEPVQDSRAFYIIKLVGVKEPEQQTLEEARERIERILHGEQRNQATSRFREQMAEKLNFEMREDRVTLVRENLLQASGK